MKSTYAANLPIAEDLVGLTHVQVVVQNPSDAERCWEGKFLVDSGAIDSMAPASVLHQIGIKVAGERTYSLADNTDIRLKWGVAHLEFLGDGAGVSILFGPEDSEPILGVTALESALIVIEPLTNTMRRLPASPLK